MNQQTAPVISPAYLEQNPLVAIALTAFLLLFTGFVCGTIASWIFVLLRVFQGKPLLNPEPWKLRVWGFADILVAAFVIVFWQRQSAIVGCSFLGLNRQEVAAEQSIPLPLATILGVGNVAAMLSICIWIFLRHRATLAQLGFGFANFGKHIGIGIITALAAIPCVFALMAAVNAGFDSQYSHPLLEEMKRQGSLNAYLLAVTSAVLIAPLVEEFLFRVLLQGWLQSAPFGSLKSIFLGQREEDQVSFVATSVDTTASNGAVQTNPYTPSHIAAVPVEATGTSGITDVIQPVPPLWPSLVTGTLFGLAHFGYGLSFIPLIVLGILLGLLYRATHSIWPSLVVHVMLNGSSMTALGVAILIEQAAK